jgi:hypothetical protein
VLGGERNGIERKSSRISEGGVGGKQIREGGGSRTWESPTLSWAHGMETAFPRPPPC